MIHPEPKPGVQRYFGPYEGIVTRVDDPEKIKRVKVRVTEIAGSLESAWASIVTPMSGVDAGVVLIPEVGANVVVEFMAGDVNRPIITGGLWKAPGHKSQLPAAAFEADTAFKGARGQDQAATALGGTIQEPSDQRAPVYPNNKVVKTKQHLLEFDDTEGKERISITHKKGTSYVDVYQDGSMVMGLGGGFYFVSGGAAAEHVKGRKDVVVDGAYSLKTTDQKIEGNNKTEHFKKVILRAMEVLMEIGGQIELKGIPIKLTSGLVIIGGTSPGPVVTTLTHPVDYVTGIPIVGTPIVQAG